MNKNTGKKKFSPLIFQVIFFTTKKAKKIFSSIDSIFALATRREDTRKRI